MHRKTTVGDRNPGVYFCVTGCPCAQNSCLLPPQAPRALGRSQTSVQLHVTWISAASDQNSWCSGTSPRAGAGPERLLQAPRAAARSVTAAAHEGPSAPTGARRASSVLPTPSGSRASLQRGAAAPFSVCGD